MLTVDTFLHALDRAWDHDWESLASVLDGVTEEEASWQAPCYRGESGGDGLPPTGTIRWQVAHVAHYKREYAARLRGDPQEASPDPPSRATETFAEDLDALRGAHREQREALAKLTDADLTADVAAFLASIIRHDTWHGGQIAVVRRLYRTRD